MKASILIVEDEAIVAASLAGKLRKLGYDISGTTGCGEDALALAAEKQPDLVLMDILLAGRMDGIEAAEKMRRQHDLPVIFLTAHSDRDTLQRAKLTEPFGYILKPFEEIELESHIQMALYKHEAERKLRESEERFRVLAEATFEGIAITENGIILETNKQLSELSGFERRELIGKQIAQFLAPEDRQRALESYQSGETRKGVYRGFHKNGAEIIFEASSRPFVWQGRAVRVMALRVITELVRTENALKESNRQIQQQLNEIRNYYDSAPIGLAIFDLELRIVRINERMSEIIGKPAAEQIGRTIREVAPQLGDMAEELRDRVLTLGEPVRDVEFSRELPGHPGAMRYWIESLFPVKDPDGKITGINIMVKDITKLKETEKALRENEERLQLAVNASLEAIWEFNLEDGSFNSNEQYVNFLGHPPDGTSQMHWWIEHLHPDDLNRVFKSFLHSFEGRATTFIEEYRMQHADGSWAHIYDRAVVVRNDKGDPCRIVGAMMDITDRKKAEEELYLSRERLKLAQQAGRIGTFDWNVRTGEVLWTEELEHIYGLPPGSFDGAYESWEKFVHPADANALREIIRLGLDGRTGFQTEFRIVRPDGAVRWIGAWGKAVQDATAGQLRMVGANIDITERKQNEAFMEQYLVRLNTLINVSFDVIGHATIAELLQRVADAARELTGAGIAITGHGYGNGSFEISAVSKSPGMDACPSADRFTVEKGGVYLDIIKSVEAICFTDAEMRAHPDWWGLPEGHVELHGLCGAPLTGADGKAQGLLMISNKAAGEDFSEIDYAMITQLATLASLSLQHLEATDEIKKRASDLAAANDRLSTEIRRRLLAEQAIMKYTDDLSRSNKELDSFSLIVSHDLQEPLRSIAGLMGLLEKHYKDKLDTRGKEYIARSQASSKRLGIMINNLLLYSRITTRAKEFEHFALDDSLNEAIENLHASVQKSQARITREPLPRIYGDSEQLVRVFQNLIGNSIKYCESAPPEIHVSCRQQGDEYIIAVRDNGEGMEPEYLENIFDIFARIPSKGHVSGTGMGLAVCKKIINRHKGKIWAESEPEKGAAFFFTIPVR